ncbi:MAG: hypothetical protein JRI43_00720 [Deltaproteobacteria bacterium]|nr:hypothetical protein [Deltaproteobacteria bacterium]
MSSEWGIRNGELRHSGTRKPVKRGFSLPGSAFRLLILLIILNIIFSPALSRSQTLSTALDRDSARVGSTVVITLSYHLPEGATLPSPPEIGGFEDLKSMDMETGQGLIRIRLLVERLGTWKTGVISVTYKDKDGNAQEITADPVSLTVISNLGDRPEDARLKPIQGILPTSPLWLKYLPWSGGLLVLLAAGLLLFYWFRRRRGGKRSFISMDPPHVLARKEIEELEGQGLFEKGDIKAFYFRFSEILRRYLESLRGFPAAEFTTEEITLRIDREQDREVLPLLRQADLVKFADSIPSTARKEEEVEKAFSYIRETGVFFEQETMDNVRTIER